MKKDQGHAMQKYCSQSSQTVRLATNFFQGLVRAVSTDVKDLVDFLRRADPGKLRPVVLYFLGPQQLIDVDRRIDEAEG